MVSRRKLAKTMPKNRQTASPLKTLRFSLYPLEPTMAYAYLFEFMRAFQIGMYAVAKDACKNAKLNAKRNMALWQYEAIAADLRKLASPTAEQILALARIDELVEFTNGMNNTQLYR